MVDELEERERSLKKARVDKQKEEATRWEETEKIKDEGRRLREERMKQMEKREQETNQAAKNENEDEEMDAPTLRKSFRSFSFHRLTHVLQNRQILLFA